MFLIPMPICQDYHILLNIRTNLGNKQVIMTYITEKEEAKIDKNETIVIHRGKHTFTIDNRCIYCYGEVDFTKGDDIELLDKLNFLSHLGIQGVPIRSNYDYACHACHSPVNRPLWAETFRPSRLVLYAHGVLGKPKRIVLFNVKVK